jgi:diguanylate cyclase (GGDEF)-like protein
MEIQEINYDKELILVVDDDSSVRGPFVEMLHHMGFRADAAVSGPEALRALQLKPYTFLLTDISMPEMDGLELIRTAVQEHPGVTAIAMTGYSKEYKYMDVVHAGAKDFINKPFGVEELEAKLRRAIIERNTREELGRLSITDSLTGLYNQRQFYKRLEQEITRADRQKNKLALIMLDLDDFKSYNDTHGHLAGDKLLKNVGNIINSNIRQGVDSGYRYGGDEFAIILIDADTEISERIADRISQAIQQECGLGASIGCIDFQPGMTVEDFVDKTDQLLYSAKEQRKNNLQSKASK